MTKKKNKAKLNSNTRPERIVYESNSTPPNNPNRPSPPKRKPNNLYKLYDKEIIDQEQYATGERLLLDYESSFRNKCTMSILDDIKVQKSTKVNNEFYVIQNLNAWDRYLKAIASIEDLNNREVVKQFCIEGRGLTEIDNKLGKRGVAEVRLWYGLKELANYYKNYYKNCRNNENLVDKT